MIIPPDQQADVGGSTARPVGCVGWREFLRTWTLGYRSCKSLVDFLKWRKNYLIDTSRITLLLLVIYLSAGLSVPLLHAPYGHLRLRYNSVEFAISFYATDLWAAIRRQCFSHFVGGAYCSRV